MIYSLILPHLYHRCPLTRGKKRASWVLGCYSVPALFWSHLCRTSGCMKVLLQVEEGGWSGGPERGCERDGARGGHGNVGGGDACEGTSRVRGGIPLHSGLLGRSAKSQWEQKEGAGRSARGCGCSRCRCLQGGRQHCGGSQGERRGHMGWIEMGSRYPTGTTIKSHTDPRSGSFLLKHNKQLVP